jgi:hypothetical protein
VFEQLSTLWYGVIEVCARVSTLLATHVVICSSSVNLDHSWHCPELKITLLFAILDMTVIVKNGRHSRTESLNWQSRVFTPQSTESFDPFLHQAWAATCVENTSQKNTCVENGRIQIIIYGMSSQTGGMSLCERHHHFVQRFNCKISMWAWSRLIGDLGC